MIKTFCEWKECDNLCNGTAHNNWFSIADFVCFEGQVRRCAFVVCLIRKTSNIVFVLVSDYMFRGCVFGFWIRARQIERLDFWTAIAIRLRPLIDRTFALWSAIKIINHWSVLFNCSAFVFDRLCSVESSLSFPKHENRHKSAGQLREQSRCRSTMHMWCAKKSIGLSHSNRTEIRICR